MFNILKLTIQNNELKQENKALYEENKINRKDVEDLDLKRCSAKILAEDTLTQLYLLQENEHKGYTDEYKTKKRNKIINDLRKQNINIIKELTQTEIEN